MTGNFPDNRQICSLINCVSEFTKLGGKSRQKFSLATITTTTCQKGLVETIISWSSNAVLELKAGMATGVLLAS
jgi:hypothetical protein